MRCTYIFFAALIAIPAWAQPQEPRGRASGSTEVLSVTPPLPFSVDERLERNKEFWVQIYTQYDSKQGLIHDAKYIDKVYEVLDLRSAHGNRERLIRDEKKKWKAVLLSLHRKIKPGKGQPPAGLTADERKVLELFKDVDEPEKFLLAAHRRRMRFQLGQKDMFLSGLVQSRAILPYMEDIFRRQGLPVELTRLPFVESSFNVKARSKVGASGIWQFMRSTGKLYLNVNSAVDDRNDPIRATDAAARLMRANYESLRNWPLAVTAYNHGRKGMMRAVRKVGSEELEDVVNGYRSRSFGFASSNFFTELLAAIEVEKNAKKYFGDVSYSKPLDFIEYRLPDYISLRELCAFLKLNEQALRELNPALTEAVYRGGLMVPAGYLLRLPYDGKLSKEAYLRLFQEGYAQIPALYKFSAQGSSSLSHHGRRRKISKGM